MKISPKDIARALIDTAEAMPNVSFDEATDSAILLLRRSCPGVRMKDFLKVVEREMKRRGQKSSALLVVPSEHSLQAEAIAPVLQAKTGQQIDIERKVEPEIIGGAVLLIDHRRIDCSIQGALAQLLKTFLQPLD